MRVSCCKAVLHEQCIVHPPRSLKMVASSGGSWTPSKEILEVVEAAILHKQSDIYAELDEVLTKYKLLFLNLLKNQGRNAAHLEELKKASKEGLKVPTHPGKTIRLPERTIQNILLSSEANDINELTCLESYLAADTQLHNFPGFSQQFVVSLLYHDGRRCILSALKLLLTARVGVTWTLDLDDRITELVQKYTDQLIEDDLVSKIIQLLQNIAVPDELNKLEKAHALGDGKHKKLITELIEEQQLLLADCLFAIASQYPFSKEDCKKLMSYLKLVAPNTSDGTLDAVTIRVLLSLLASFNCDVVDSAINDDDDDLYLQLPYFKDSTFFSSLHQDIIRPDAQVWQTQSLKYVIQLCWGIFLRTCSGHAELADSQADILEDDDGVIDAALDSGVLSDLVKTVVNYETFYKEEYFVKLVHSFVTSFIVKFPMKIKEMRNRGDENARIIQAHQADGIEPPQGLKHDFQDLMALVHALYKTDPLGLQLCNNYWLPLEPLGDVFMPQPLKKQLQAVDQKKVMLNKFVRLAGDILLQPVYVPYINMLASLSTSETAALFCFRLLASDGNVSHINSCAVTWDHFFSSIKQYYLSLRQHPDATDHRSHLHRHQEISPEELDGLEATLKLINTLAKHNENVRVAFCENQGWLPVASLLGLVSCAVPPSLKGLLMQTLASFAKSPEIASSLWVSLEASQVLQTSTSTATLKKSGIAVELAEIEARNETYPETLGFLELIDSLTDVVIPQTLGAGHRVPGFDPYFQFLINDVYLKFRTRAYQDPKEKWKVGTAVLKILLKLVKNYDLAPMHFEDQKVEIQNVNFGKAAKPSGFQLLVLLLNDTPMLRTTLSVISEGEDCLKSLITTNSRKEALEDIVELCLDLLNTTLEKQSLFMDMAKEYCPSLLLTPLEELLLSVNPRTAAPDYLYVLGRYMTINNIRSTVIAGVVKVFKYVCKHSKFQQQIIAILANDEILGRELMVGFAEKLEIPDAEVEGAPEADTLDLTQEKSMYDLIRQDIVQLLMSAVEHNPPNLSQFMIGFDVKQPLSVTTLQDPGVGGFPKTCLHSVIEVLNRGLNETDKRLTGLTPKLTEDLYHLLFILSAHPEMGGAVRRYLRTNTDFIQNHCRLLPFIEEGDEDSNEVLYIKRVNQQAWFLKTVAVELKVLAARSMRSSLQKLVSQLLSDRLVAADNPVVQNTTSLTKSNIENSFFIRDSLTQTSLSMPFTTTHTKNILTTILRTLSFKQRYPPNVEFNFFDYTAVEQLIHSCEEETESGVTLCNVSKLYKVVMNEINSSQISSGAAQRQEIMKELRVLLKHSVDRNLVREIFRAKQNAIEAWRQVIEVLFAVCPVDILPLEVKYTAIIDILGELNQKVNDADNLAELTSPVCGIILSLMANLWFTVQQNEKGRVSHESSLNISLLVSLFPGIIDCVINMGSSPARTRSSLYGALLYYLQIGKSHDNEDSMEGVSDNIFDKRSQQEWKNSTYATILKYGEPLLDIITKDTMQGPCITRMMALSLCDALISLDWKEKLMMWLTSRGYLRVLIDRLIDEDVELQNVLSPQAQSMKPLYLFQSKMALFSKMASTEYGCQMLLQHGLLSRLAECQFLDFHVDSATTVFQSSMTPSHVNDPFVPSLDERYSKIFSSLAKLVLAFLAQTGLRHKTVITQVQHLVIMHEELFLHIFQDKHDAHSLNSLQQLSLAISIVSLLPPSASVEEPYDVLSEQQRHWRAFMKRIQMLMPVLLRKYSSEASKKYLKELLSDHRDLSSGMFVLSPWNVQTAELKNLLFQIRSRILTFFKNNVSVPGLSGSSTRTIFSPTYTEHHSHDSRLSKLDKSIHTKASLSILVEELKHGPESLKLCLEQTKQIDRKLEKISELSYDELQEILTQEIETDRLPYRQRVIVANRILSKLRGIKETEANLISYNVEQALYLLWRHVDYYYLHCIPTEDSFVYDSEYAKPVRARRLTGSSFSSAVKETTLHNVTDKTSHDTGITKEDLHNFKQESMAILNEQFWKKIMDTEHIRSQSRTRLSFLSSLVRRIQSVIKLNTVV